MSRFVARPFASRLPLPVLERRPQLLHECSACASVGTDVTFKGVWKFGSSKSPDTLQKSSVLKRGTGRGEESRSNTGRLPVCLERWLTLKITTSQDL